MRLKCKQVISLFSALALCVSSACYGSFTVRALEGEDSVPELSEDSIFDVISSDSVLTYNSDTGYYEGSAKVEVTGIGDDECVIVDVDEDVTDSGGLNLVVSFTDDSEQLERKFKNGDIIGISYHISGYESGNDYSVALQIKGTVKTDYEAYEIPVISADDWDWYIYEDTKEIKLKKYKGANSEVVIYPQYKLVDDEDAAVYDTVMAVTAYDTTYTNNTYVYDDDKDSYVKTDKPLYTDDLDEIGTSTVFQLDTDTHNTFEDDGVTDYYGAPFLNNTTITKVVFLDGVKIGTTKGDDYTVCSDNRSDYDITSTKLYGELENDDDFYTDIMGNDTKMLTSDKGSNMQGMFAGCTNLEVVENIPDDVVKMENTFRDCTHLTTVTNLPSGLIDMGKTFMNCSRLVDIPQIPGTVINMNATFRNCKSLNPEERVVVPVSVKNLMETFRNCQSMELCPIIYPDTQVYNLYYTFLECRSMTEIPVIPETVFAAECAFKNCTSATNVYENNPIKIASVNSLGGKYTGDSDVYSYLEDMFRNCGNLTADVYFDEFDNASYAIYLPVTRDGMYVTDGKFPAVRLRVRYDADGQPVYSVMYGYLYRKSISTYYIWRFSADYPDDGMGDANSVAINNLDIDTEDIHGLFNIFDGISAYLWSVSAEGSKFYTKLDTDYIDEQIDNINSNASGIVSKLRTYFSDDSVKLLSPWNSSYEYYGDKSSISTFNFNETTDNKSSYYYMPFRGTKASSSNGYAGADITLYLPEKGYDINSRLALAIDKSSNTGTVSVENYTEYPEVVVDYTSSKGTSLLAESDYYQLFNLEVITTSLSLEYYLYSDFAAGTYSDEPYETVTFSYGDAILENTYIPDNLTKDTLTEDGYDCIETYKFKGWAADSDFDLTGSFTEKNDVTVKLYADYEFYDEKHVVSKEFNGISVVHEPDKTDYTAGETFDNTGLIVSAEYKLTWSDGDVTYASEAPVSYDVDLETPLEEGDETVIVSRTEGDVTETADVAITVNDEIVSSVLNSIVISSHADKLIYDIGDTFDRTGLVVDAIYNTTYASGRVISKTVYGVSYNITDEDAALAYGTNGVTVTFTDGVTVSVIESISVRSSRYVTVEGILTYNDGTPIADRLVEIHSEVQTVRTDSNGRYKFENVEVGNHILTVYGSDDKTVDGTVQIFVDDPTDKTETVDLVTFKDGQTVNFKTDISDDMFTINGSIIKPAEVLPDQPAAKPSDSSTPSDAATPSDTSSNDNNDDDDDDTTTVTTVTTTSSVVKDTPVMLEQDTLVYVVPPKTGVESYTKLFAAAFVFFASFGYAVITILKIRKDNK